MIRTRLMYHAACKVGFNHSNGRTHSWRFSTFFKKWLRVNAWEVLIRVLVRTGIASTQKIPSYVGHLCHPQPEFRSLVIADQKIICGEHSWIYSLLYFLDVLFFRFFPVLSFFRCMPEYVVEYLQQYREHSTSSTAAQHNVIIPAQSSKPSTCRSGYVSKEVLQYVRTCMRHAGCFPGAWSSWHLQILCLHRKCWTI